MTTRSTLRDPTKRYALPVSIIDRLYAASGTTMSASFKLAETASRKKVTVAEIRKAIHALNTKIARVVRGKRELESLRTWLVDFVQSIE